LFGWSTRDNKSEFAIKLDGLSTAELGHGLCSFRDSMLGKLSRKHQTDSGLNLAGAQCSLLVVGSKLTGFTGNALKDIINERVHNGHSLLGDSSIRVDLLEDLVDVRRVRFHTLLVLLLVTSLLGGLCRLGRLLGGCLGHFDGEME